jgi:hypothetical protein
VDTGNQGLPATLGFDFAFGKEVARRDLAIHAATSGFAAPAFRTEAKVLLLFRSSCSHNGYFSPIASFGVVRRKRSKGGGLLTLATRHRPKRFGNTAKRLRFKLCDRAGD